jgi:hypothetical protein
MQESLKRHCQDEENAGSGRHGQADIFFLHRNGEESTPEVNLHYPLPYTGSSDSNCLIHFRLASQKDNDFWES